MKDKKETKKKIKYTKTMTLGEIIALNEENAITLLGFGMHCCGCPMSQMETLEEACEVHGVNIKMVLDRLNEE